MIQATVYTWGYLLIWLCKDTGTVIILLASRSSYSDDALKSYGSHFLRFWAFMPIYIDSLFDWQWHKMSNYIKCQMSWKKLQMSWNFKCHETSNVMISKMSMMIMIMMMLWPLAVAPGVTHFVAYHRPPDGNFLSYFWSYTKWIGTGKTSQPITSPQGPN